MEEVATRVRMEIQLAKDKIDVLEEQKKELYKEIKKIKPEVASCALQLKKLNKPCCCNAWYSSLVDGVVRIYDYEQQIERLDEKIKENVHFMQSISDVFYHSNDTIILTLTETESV